eukprot:1626366-Rhodomonas_salina.1
MLSTAAFCTEIPPGFLRFRQVLLRFRQISPGLLRFRLRLQAFHLVLLAPGAQSQGQSSPLCLRAPYPISSTDLAYGAVLRELRGTERACGTESSSTERACGTLISGIVCSSGTERAYDLAYAPMKAA